MQVCTASLPVRVNAVGAHRVCFNIKEEKSLFVVNLR